MLTAVIAVFVWLLGLCVGSFLNVVLYRLPLGLSISKPARSFCPRCRSRIAAYDNLPVLSWILLRGRCRLCRAPISAQYPLVEALTGLCFVLVYRLLFIDFARYGVEAAVLPTDAALLIAWLVLTAAMVACAGMDLVSYMVDTRITDVALAAGLLCCAAWPRGEYFEPYVGGPSGAAALAALLASGAMLWLTVWRLPVEENRASGDAQATPEKEHPGGANVPVSIAVSGARDSFRGTLAVCVFVGLAAWLIAGSFAPGATIVSVQGTTPRAPGDVPLHVLSVPASLLALFGAAVLISGQRRDADHELSAAIEEERPQARRVVLGELGWLLPIIAAAAVAYAIVVAIPSGATAWSSAIGWSPFGGLTPVAGLSYAALGAMVGAMAGWILRIGFTLLFGREALGTGDIFILAAAGAAAGWDIALLGLLLSVGFALAGWLLTLMLKSSAILSFGPWLALGFVAALWLNRPAARVAAYYRDSVALAWREDRSLVLMMAGVMLAGTAVAVVVARLARVLAERAARAPRPQR